MKIKVINRNLDTFNMEFKVLNMNYDSVLINNNGQKKLLKSADVELIPESSLESIIAKYKDIIKIKLNKGISLAFYSVIIKLMEDKIGNKITSIDVLEDEFEFIKKGIWRKKMLLMINESITLRILTSGTKFGENFNVTISDVQLSEFIEECLFSIDEADKKIKEQESNINIYKKALKNALSCSVTNRQNKLLLGN
ncbi:MAG: hypothetical protein K0R54_3871 [Clostridiaceae bacterium]|jgi:hypothetical protein|nr:hypothetical protein [Clostridiaceae bacterium]